MAAAICLKVMQMMQNKPTARQMDVLQAIAEYWRDMGYAPSYREIALATGIKSSATIWTHVDNLEKAGFIEHDQSKPRALVLTDAGAKALGVSNYAYAAQRNPAAYALTEMIRQIVRDELSRLYPRRLEP